MVEQSARSAKTLVEVRVNGEAVGRLTPRMSEEVLPVVRHLAARGALAVARAILKGNSVKADVVLHPARANQIPQQWLDAPPIQGVPRQVTSTAAADAAGPGTASQAQIGVTAAWRFNPPPGWPSPPDGWTPSPDWRPDPSWPPAPSNWQFWVAR